MIHSLTERPLTCRGSWGDLFSVPITEANARECQALAVQARHRNREDKIKAVELHTIAEQLAEQPSDYITKRIARARAQIERLEDLALTLTDALDIERTARAVASWSELERVLSGRPLPGSRRPGKDRAAQEPEIKPL